MTSSMHESIPPVGGESFPASPERSPDMPITRPLGVDLFYLESGCDTNLPPEVASHPDVIANAAERRHLYTVLKDTFGKMGGVNVEDAVAAGTLSPDEVAETYSALAAFLSADPDHVRLLLYLPSELLPGSLAGDGKLANATESFIRSYRSAWDRLMHETDLRVSFTDGDTIDLEIPGRKPERVRKAAHLIPDLVGRGMFTADEMLSYAKQADPAIRQAVFDVFPVLADRGLIPEGVWQSMVVSDDEAFRTAAFRSYHTLREGVPLPERIQDVIVGQCTFGTGRASWEDGERLSSALGMIDRGVLDADRTDAVERLAVAGLRNRMTHDALAERVYRFAIDHPDSTIAVSMVDVRSFSAATAAVPSSVDDLDPSRAWAQYRRIATAIAESRTSVASTFPDVISDYRSALADIDGRFSRDAIRAYGMTEARVYWLKRERQKQAVRDAVTRMLPLLADGTVTRERLFSLFGEPDNDLRLLAVSAVFAHIEHTSRSDCASARAYLTDAMDTVVRGWLAGDVPIRDSIASGMSRLVHAGVADRTDAVRLGVVDTDLSVPFPATLPDALGSDGVVLRNAVEDIRWDPRLRKHLHPVILAFGSRLKGYAGYGADTDIAVFVRDIGPETDAAIRQITSRSMTAGRVVKLLLGDDGHLMDVEGETIHGALADWGHILLSGAWFGDPDDIRRIARRAASPMFRHRADGGLSGTAHRYVVREMERDILQYRLMHRGYAARYPMAQRHIDEHGDAIDATADFWDPGFRRTATLLFLSRVFLPVM